MAGMSLFAVLFRVAGAANPLPVGDSTNAYVGAEPCRECHARAFEIWSSSFHARASLSLATTRGREMAHIATTSAIRGEPDCVECHASPGRPAFARRGLDFHAEDGVQCETCHGPGALHVKIETAKDTLAGHRIHRPAQNADLCQVCHYGEKPLHDSRLDLAPFEYESFRLRTAHPTPADERARR